MPHGLFGQRVSFVSSGIITFTTQAPGAEQKVALIERCNKNPVGILEGWKLLCQTGGVSLVTKW